MPGIASNCIEICQAEHSTWTSECLDIQQSGQNPLVVVPDICSLPAIGQDLRSNQLQRKYNRSPTQYSTLSAVAASDVAGNVAWWTGAPNKGTPPYKMVVQDNGNVVVSDSLNQAMWATNTARG